MKLWTFLTNQRPCFWRLFVPGRKPRLFLPDSLLVSPPILQTTDSIENAGKCDGTGHVEKDCMSYYWQNHNWRYGGRKLILVRSVGKSDISMFVVTQSDNRAVPQMPVIYCMVVEAGGEDVDVDVGNKAMERWTMRSVAVFWICSRSFCDIFFINKQAFVTYNPYDVDRGIH